MPYAHAALIWVYRTYKALLQENEMVNAILLEKCLSSSGDVLYEGIKRVDPYANDLLPFKADFSWDRQDVSPDPFQPPALQYLCGLWVCVLGFLRGVLRHPNRLYEPRFHPNHQVMCEFCE